ncbi:MAG: hypothetical protein RLZZ231_1440 [Bacteroidota bacterium]
MKFNFLFKSFLFALIITMSISCDKDYNDIGTNVVGEDDHYLASVDSTMSVLAYNHKTGPVQTNGLAINALGFYNNPVFGKTTASFVSQVTLSSPDPTFYNPSQVVVDSVYLYVPYYSTFKSKDNTTGDTTYEDNLDSIQNQAGKFKLSVYESGYFLRDFDPATGFQEPQKYYSDQTIDFTSAIVGTRLNDTTDTKQNDDFEFSNKEIKLSYQKNGAAVVKERLAPGMFLTLNRNFFKNKIVNAPAGKLVNNNIFKEYFRGLYFKAQPAADSPNQGALGLLDFSRAKITMVYHDETSATVATRVRKTILFNLSGNSVNLFENDENSTYQSAVLAANPVLGDEKLYLRGQEGSMTIIELFKGEDIATSTELTAMRNNNWLINEANLTFYIDRNAMGDAPEPNRIYLYDLENNMPIIDYYADATKGSTAKFNKLIHSGILEVETSETSTEYDKGEGIRYKIRLTNHIRNLIKNNPDLNLKNVKLGLVVTENIATVTNSGLKNPIVSPATKYTPSCSVMNPLGTVLYGTSSSVIEAKRMKLKIYYTKPN